MKRDAVIGAIFNAVKLNPTRSLIRGHFGDARVFPLQIRLLQ